MKADEEKLREHLDWLGLTLLTTEPYDQITIPHWVVGEIVAALSSTPAGKAGRPKPWTAEIVSRAIFHLPKAGRPKPWTAEIVSRAIFHLLNGRPVNALAREIAKETGQSESSARRRLRQLKKSSRFKNWRR